MRRREILARLIGATLGVLGLLTAIVLGLATPAGAQTPATPTPPTPAHLPINVNLGGLHISLDVPLTLPGLLGRPATTKQTAEPTQTPAPANTSAPTVHSTPKAQPHPTVKHPKPVTHHATRAPKRTAPAVVADPVQRPSKTHHSSTTPRKAPASHPTPVPVSAFQQVIHPSVPVAILVAVLCVCGLGTAFVVRASGHRKKRAA